MASFPANEKNQLIHRLPLSFVTATIADFNKGLLSCTEACWRLEVGKTRLYQLRDAWRKNRSAFCIEASGGDHAQVWPREVVAFLKEFIPLQSPPNYQLICDELLRLHNFRRTRSSVEAFVKKHLPRLVSLPQRKPRPFRRFRRARFGELWQHDSSIHQWWPAAQKQVLLLTVDDHSGLTLGGRFVPRDITWAHFCHFRALFEAYGIPQLVYTDGFKLFGNTSCMDGTDPKSEFQRALRALGVAHRVAPTPQAKGKIERRFGTFQKRLVALLAHAKVRSFEQANEVLHMEIERQNNKLHSSTGKVPMRVFEEDNTSRSRAMRPCPPRALLDLHFSLRAPRRVYNDNTIEFDGKAFQITPTAKKYVTVAFHPGEKVWVLEKKPKNIWPVVLGHFSL